MTLLEGWPTDRGAGRYAIPAYSEFMPPPRLGRRAYGASDPLPFREGDPFGWTVSEREEGLELAPGLDQIAQQLLESLRHLAAGRAAHGISRAKLSGNPYWPEDLAQRAPGLRHERFVLLLPLALSRTQDDKGRVRWTLLGSSELGPARPLWRSFLAPPGPGPSPEDGPDFLRRLLAAAFGAPAPELADLRAAGLRFLRAEGAASLPFPHWSEEPLPEWLGSLELDPGEPLERVRFLLTFRAFAELPPQIRRAYLAGELHLLPFPGSLLFWGAEPYRRLEGELPFAIQIPLQHGIARHEAPSGVRVPQSGWLHEPSPRRPTHDARHGPLRDLFKRTHRWARVHRHEDELAVTAREEKLVHVLFSASAADVGLYGKPMARNAQIWSNEFRRVLDGPSATREEIEGARAAIRAGGSFGYRFAYPAMRVGRYQVHWQRPLVAYSDARSGRATLLTGAPLGVLTAYDAAKPDPARAIELWPRLARRGPELAALELPHADRIDVEKILEARDLRGAPLPRSFARGLARARESPAFERWLAELPALGEALGAQEEPAPDALTYRWSARRPFEVRYWKAIASLAEGRFLTKNNADCVLDPVTQAELAHHERDLAALGDHLLDQHRRAVAAARMAGKAWVGELPLRWRTDFDFPWMGGWLDNRRGSGERNLIAVIPGRDRGEAVVMADHYDTAYMEDRYETAQGGDGARLAAAGADDNHSATAALLLAAPIFLALSRAGKLARDIWLVHLTGEEFPADCLGARHLCQALVEGELRMRLPADRRWRDLSRTRIRGVYVLDMIAHNSDRDRDLFQIAPGACAGSLWLAEQAHLAARAWNEGTLAWNRRAGRRGARRGRRSARAARVPALARHLALRADVRLPSDPRSALYNTDGQIFSDAGVPVVLLMENYDIDREGYHDTHDTLANIDLDYGAALAAIAIESVARVAAAR